MRFPIFLPSILIFVVVYAIKRRHGDKKRQKVYDDFWERERQANMTRKKDISNLDYVPFSLERLPIGTYTDTILADYESTLQKLSETKCIDLSAYSNTDLKLLYGTANLTILSEYDENYHILTSTLQAYANRKLELNQLDDAICILEYAMELKLDSSTIYTQLATLYKDNGMEAKISSIISAVSTMDESFSHLVLPKLEAFHISE